MSRKALKMRRGRAVQLPADTRRDRSLPLLCWRREHCCRIATSPRYVSTTQCSVLCHPTPSTLMCVFPYVFYHKWRRERFYLRPTAQVLMLPTPSFGTLAGNRKSSTFNAALVQPPNPHTWLQDPLGRTLWSSKCVLWEALGGHFRPKMAIVGSCCGPFIYYVFIAKTVS